MLRSLGTLSMLVCMAVFKEPLYAIAAGLFELASVLYAVTRPIRLKEVKIDERKDWSR